MSFQNCKNVWGKCNRYTGNDGLQTTSEIKDQREFGNPKKEEGPNFNWGNLALGPFGSKSLFGTSSGPASLPTVGSKRRNSRIYHFELGTCSSGSSCSSSAPASGPSSVIGFGMEPKRYNWGLNSLSKTEQAMEVTSGGSSRSSGCYGSRTSINLGEMVENIFKEEIGKMAENLQRRSCFWN